MKWKPIKTAPRGDHIEILLARFDSKGELSEIDIGSWGFIENSDWDGKPVYDWYSNRGIEEPTHWLEAPELPDPIIESDEVAGIQPSPMAIENSSILFGIGTAK